MHRFPLAVMALPLVLAGCFQMPASYGAAPVRNAPPPVTVIDPAPGVAPSASVAENACVSAGQAQGLAVQGVVGTRETMGTDGMAQSRDVMLRVARGQQVYDVRCAYSYASAQARIMSL